MCFSTTVKACLWCSWRETFCSASWFSLQWLWQALFGVLARCQWASASIRSSRGCGIHCQYHEGQGNVETGVHYYELLVFIWTVWGGV